MPASTASATKSRAPGQAQGKGWKGSAFLRVGGTLLSVLAFVALLGGSAWLGIRMGLRDLPDSARAVKGHPPGTVLTVGQGGEPLLFAAELQALRDFYFRHPNEDERRSVEIEGQQVRRVFGATRLRTVKQDADGVLVEIESGPFTGRFWIHQAQLPEPGSQTESAAAEKSAEGGEKAVAPGRK